MPHHVDIMTMHLHTKDNKLVVFLAGTARYMPMSAIYLHGDTF